MSDRMTYYYPMLMMIAPFGTLIILSLTYAILYHCYWKPSGRWSDNGHESSSNARLVIVRSWLTILSLLYGQICYYSLSLFCITEWRGDGFFAKDPAIVRDSTQHLVMVGISMAAWPLYIIGIPLLMMTMSRGCWQQGTTWRQRQSATGALLESYKERYWLAQQLITQTSLFFIS
jgi:hypothetical protein